LDGILSRSGPLPATFATDRQALKKGRMYIAPPGRHLIVDGDQLSLGVGPRENNARPAIDPMLRSAALCCGHRSVGVVLTGTLSDGASGLRILGVCGGITVVQDPRDAAFPEMPLMALERASPDHVVHLANMPALLENLVRRPAAKPKAAPATVKYEVEIARSGGGSMNTMDRIGRRSVLSCPDCGGVMWEVDEAGPARYRCHVGHAYTGELMNLAVDESLRRALASALRALDERSALADRLRSQAIRQGRTELAQIWAERQQDFTREAGTISEAIRRLDQVVVPRAAE
jgi:two-component system, chemotaxis family, protein-glutamate methylesterase/glutaminase